VRRPLPRLHPGAAPAIILVCAALWLRARLAGTPTQVPQLISLLFPSGQAIWQGSWWGLVSASFVHLTLLHLLFNMYWVWRLGTVLEEAVGTWRFLLFWIGGAVAGAGVELAVSGQTGIGASGVIYAVFGFLWVARPVYPRFREALPPELWRLAVIWLFLALALTELGVLRIANGAHAGGLVFGVAVGWLVACRRRRPLAAAALAGLAAVTLCSLFWAPWLEGWVSTRALAAHEAGRYGEAEALYKQALARGASPSFALHNLALVYFATGRRDRFAEAVQRLAAVQPSAAGRLRALLERWEAGAPPPDLRQEADPDGRSRGPERTGEGASGPAD
jgi:GlpG protein